MELKRTDGWRTFERICEDLKRGCFICIFCGETFMEWEHIYSVCGQNGHRREGYDPNTSLMLTEVPFTAWINLDKQMKRTVRHSEADTYRHVWRKEQRTVGEAMGISAVTVRTHKFNIQKMKREPDTAGSPKSDRGWGCRKSEKNSWKKLRDEERAGGGQTFRMVSRDPLRATACIRFLLSLIWSKKRRGWGWEDFPHMTTGWENSKRDDKRGRIPQIYSELSSIGTRLRICRRMA